MAKEFKTAAAFKASLDAHLRTKAKERNIPVGTLQLKFVIERLLARLFQSDNPGWLLKGGFAMDLRFRPRARTTKDIDLTVMLQTDSSAQVTLTTVWDRLQDVTSQNLGDYLTYRISSPKKDLTNAPGGGGRFACEVLLVGKTYAKFHIDVGLGDPVIGKPEVLNGDDLLDFMGIAPARVLAIPQPQQFAEKVHAYTFPWGERINSRTKDLVDLVLLIERGTLDPAIVREAVKTTFERRATHPHPEKLSPPPAEWRVDFGPMAVEANLSTEDCDVAYGILNSYWLMHLLGATW
jgi:hypothetical protein